MQITPKKSFYHVIIIGLSFTLNFQTSRCTFQLDILYFISTNKVYVCGFLRPNENRAERAEICFKYLINTLATHHQ